MCNVVKGQLIHGRETVRIAHLSDLHVASSLHAIFDALQFLAYTAPALGAFLFGLEKGIRRLPPGAQFPVRIIMAITGMLSGAAAVTLNSRARAGLQFILALIFNHNRSIAQDRKSILASLSDNNVDHVMITGDLTNTARAEEFEIIRNELMGFDWWGDRLSVVPGNHDRIGFPRSVPFENYFKDTMPVRPDADLYPTMRELIPGVFLIGVDSCLPESHADVWDRVFMNVRGSFQQPQIGHIRDFIRNLKSGAVLICLHHPPIDRWLKRWSDRMRRQFFKEPKNSDQFRDAIKGRPTILFCGHDHPVDHVFDPMEFGKIAISPATGLRINDSISYRIFTVSPDAAPEVETVVLPLSKS